MAIAKPADTRHPIHTLLKNRWSPVAFSDKNVETDKLQSLLEAVRWSPSSFNEQPWNLVVALKSEPEEFKKMLGCLTEANQAWAHAAPVLILTVTKTMYEKNKKPNLHAWHDIGLAAACLTVQATQLGLVVHQMGGIQPEKARETYGIPGGFMPVTAIAVGYMGNLNALPMDLQNRDLADRKRKPLKEFVFAGKWGQPSPLA
jgi:nitroreductase